MAPLRLKRLHVRGFKSLVSFGLTFPTPMKVLIGANGSGKSSILQALDFIKYFATGVPEFFFQNRSAAPADFISLQTNSAELAFDLLFETSDGGCLRWTFRWDSASGRNLFEQLSGVRDGRTDVLFGSRDGKTLIGDEEGGSRPMHSLLPDIAGTTQTAGWDRDHAGDILRWTQANVCLDLLSPADMRSGARKLTGNIGQNGHFLASFLNGLDEEARYRVAARLRDYHNPFVDLRTERLPDGRVALRVREDFDDGHTLGTAQLSDGFLRLLALATIPEFRPEPTLVLLDEVEDGIDPHVVPRVIDSLRQSVSGIVVMTSHSPLLVNMFDPEEVDFLVRVPGGATLAVPLSEIEPFKDEFEYFGPGELWSQSSNDHLFRWAEEAVRRRSGCEPVAEDGHGAS